VSVTYEARPPASARAARNAWDYFVAHRATKARPISELFYCPNYDHIGPHWCCILGILPHDTMKWNFSESDLTWSASTALIRDWVSDGKPTPRRTP
jgi:hypothetical protein